ncbi:MAG: GEVED domain-containing protein [Bacteroidota bacterium]
MKKLYLKFTQVKIGFKTILMVLGLFGMLQKTAAQSSISYSIGEMLAAGPAGIVLADGTVAHAEIITLNSSNVYTANHGSYNTMQMGGLLNGVNNVNDNTGTVDDSALTITEYNGSKRIGDFTRISAIPNTIDNGTGSKFGNAVGFRIWFSKPINVEQFLMMDCDGNGQNPTATNGEWFSCFGYNNTTLVTPSAITLAPTTDLVSGSHAVNANWSLLTDSKIPGADPITSMTFPRISSSHNNADPDDTGNQGLFDFNAPVDNIFFLWGIYGVVGTGASAEQNSGVSPLVFSLYTDFGDGPDTYHTTKVNNGASHEIYNYIPEGQNSTLTLGSGVNFEPTGNATPAANSDSDDGVASVALFDCATSNYSTTVSLLNNTGSSANLYAWVDFNQNGEFETGEVQTVTVPSSPTQQIIVLNWSGIVVPIDCGIIGTSYMRLRLTFDDLTDDISSAVDERSFGGARGGEVEDYKIVMKPQPDLPVRLISFAAGQMQDKIALSWTVSNEIDGKYYEIEKSTNGIDFIVINKITTKSYSSFNTYQSLDINPANGSNYYRLKMTDKSGAIQYSKIITVRVGNKIIANISVRPNPFIDHVDINIDQEKAAPIFINIVDAVGKTIYKNTIAGSAGINLINIDQLSKLSVGLYVINVNTSKGTTQFKLVKRN